MSIIKQIKEGASRTIAPAGFLLTGITAGFAQALAGCAYGPWLQALPTFLLITAVAGTLAALRRMNATLPPFARSCACGAAAAALLPFLFATGPSAPILHALGHIALFAALGALLACLAAPSRESADEKALAGHVCLAALAGAAGCVLGMRAFQGAGLGSVALHATAAALIVLLIAYALASLNCVQQGHPAAADASEATPLPAYGELAGQAGLSRRETDILQLLAQGMDTADICSSLVLSRNTVKTHLRNIYRKLDVHSRDELLVLLKDR